jgi:hypothetical protein
VSAFLAEADDMLKFINECNKPTVLAEGGFERLHEIKKRLYTNSNNETHPYLGDQELEFLSVRRGSLTMAERGEIESHVVHTYKFLVQIPWTRELRRVPEIAYAHHEKLDGGGYPLKLPGGSIPVQSRMMTISDIYDALTASDRPYKKALPHEKAVDILYDEAKQQKVDKDLLDVFVEAKVHETLQQVKPPVQALSRMDQMAMPEVRTEVPKQAPKVAPESAPKQAVRPQSSRGAPRKAPAKKKKAKKVATLRNKSRPASKPKKKTSAVKKKKKRR